MIKAGLRDGYIEGEKNNMKKEKRSGACNGSNTRCDRIFCSGYWGCAGEKKLTQK